MVTNAKFSVNHKMSMIVDKNDVPTSEGETKIPFFAMIYGSIYVLI